MPRFLMGNDPADRMRVAQLLKHLHRRPRPHDKGRAHPGQRAAQIRKAFGRERPVPGRDIGQAPIVGFNHENRQDRPQACRLGQRRVIDRPQIMLEPNENIHGTQT
jgi:hypothetical protein